MVIMGFRRSTHFDSCLAREARRGRSRLPSTRPKRPSNRRGALPPPRAPISLTTDSTRIGVCVASPGYAEFLSATAKGGVAADRIGRCLWAVAGEGGGACGIMTIGKAIRT